MSVNARCWGVIPAAGSGSRMAADCPKQFLEIGGVSLLRHSLRALLACDAVVGVVVALPGADPRAAELAREPRVEVVSGGARRADSVLAALRQLQKIADAADWVLVHDAARPCVAVADIERLIAQVSRSGSGALLAQPVLDTVKQADAAGQVCATLDRTSLWRAQTPQMFRLGELQAALVAALDAGVEVTDEASAMEWAGHPVQLVAGSARNLKVTVAEDLQLAAWYLDGAGRRAEGGDGCE
ncbi:2-C-methyl-D-erythritol 4-phosphate cytidylyltransferase [Kineobactrum salinum]|uniref:2-C-methyl-D-erythritol 4-phosphate cytidylyltransferase n=1 Tax=Kineobactrum salinum TaxID=2708301 RepID=A0A6C0TXV5_9GAMM|nr:2-C-methyl-D-erythritol 4-phosphate cytidylyltransferase [Kineobactrum salinum]QIB64229.1 2-C-methyl-D-erythritol 4-phosphate cytidylyltransferase [Kineobactrum salinum]